MKRCPQCEFVYEDEQTLCDMDGSKLAFDSRPLPKLQALADAPDHSAPKTFWRGRLIPAAAGLVLATVLGLVYYVSTHRQALTEVVPAAQSRQSIAPQTVAETPKIDTTNPSPESTNSGNVVPETVSDESEVKPSPTPKTETVAELTPSKKKRPVNLNSSQPRTVKPAPIEEKRKQESKIGSILKKTGRLLKKPFKF